MLKGFDENGVLRNVVVTEDGAIKIVGENTGGNSDSTVTSIEKTLNASIQTLSNTSTNVSIGSKVTEIMIANYSDTADVTMTIGTTSYVIGSNLAVELPINATVTTIGLVSTAADTKVQIVVKGELSDD